MGGTHSWHVLFALGTTRTRNAFTRGFPGPGSTCTERGVAPGNTSGRHCFVGVISAPCSFLQGPSGRVCGASSAVRVQCKSAECWADPSTRCTTPHNWRTPHVFCCRCGMVSWPLGRWGTGTWRIRGAPIFLRPAPPCDIPSGGCFFTGPWTVPRSSLRMLRRVAAFCRPLRCCFRVRGAQSLVYWGCVGCGRCRLYVSGAQ